MSTLRRGRLLIYQLQRLRLRRRLRNRKSSKRLQIESKRHFLFQTPVLGIFRTGSVRMYLPSMPSSGHTWKCILKHQLSEFEQFLFLKTLSIAGFKPPSASRKSESLQLCYRVIYFKYSFLSFYIRIYPSPRVCGHGCVLMAFSSSLQSLRIILLCREHI